MLEVSGRVVYVVGLQFVSVLESCPRRAVVNHPVRVRMCSSFRTDTSYPAQNTYIFRFYSCYTVYSLAYTAFRQVKIVTETLIISYVTYIFFTS